MKQDGIRALGGLMLIEHPLTRYNKRGLPYNPLLRGRSQYGHCSECGDTSLSPSLHPELLYHCYTCGHDVEVFSSDASHVLNARVGELRMVLERVGVDVDAAMERDDIAHPGNDVPFW